MPLPAAVLLVPLALGVFAKRKPATGRGGEGNVKSHREDHMDTDDSGASGEVARVLRQALGIPYSYGAGSPATPWLRPARGNAGGLGLDCSGFAQVALVRLGRLDASAPDRGSASLSKLGQEVPWGAQRAGDLAFYGTPVSHVMVVLDDAGAGGDAPVIGASGGRSTTNGDDPNARIKEFSSAKYRKDFRFFRRL